MTNTAAESFVWHKTASRAGDAQTCLHGCTKVKRDEIIPKTTTLETHQVQQSSKGKFADDFLDVLPAMKQIYCQILPGGKVRSVWKADVSRQGEITVGATRKRLPCPRRLVCSHAAPSNQDDVLSAFFVPRITASPAQIVGRKLFHYKMMLRYQIVWRNTTWDDAVQYITVEVRQDANLNVIKCLSYCCCAKHWEVSTKLATRFRYNSCIISLNFSFYYYYYFFFTKILWCHLCLGFIIF